MTTPLTSPAPAPTSRAVTTMTIQCTFCANCWVARVVAQTEARATIAPTDRSMPPPMITKVMPTLTTPMTAASRRIVSRLSKSANRWPPGARAQPKHRQQVVEVREPGARGGHPDDAEDRKGDDQAQVAAEATAEQA